MASYSDLLSKFRDYNIEDDQGNIYPAIFLFNAEKEIPDFDHENPNYFPSNFMINSTPPGTGSMSQNIIATINWKTNPTGTVTITLKDGSYCEINYNITVSGGHIQNFDANCAFYNDQGVQDTTIGGAFYINFLSFNAGQIEAWEDEDIIDIVLLSDMRYGQYYNPDSGQMEDMWNTFNSGFCFIPSSYEPFLAQWFPLWGLPDSTTSAGQSIQYILFSTVNNNGFSLDNPNDVPVTHFLNWLDGGLSEKKVDPEPGQDTESGQDAVPDGGMDGDFDIKSDEILPDPVPNINVQNLGLFGVYKMSANRVQSLSQFLWSQNFFDNVLKNFASPMENIISFGVVPFNPSVGADTEIYVGNMPTGVTGFKLSQLYYTKDCGAVDIADVGTCYNSFADYDPYTSLWLYLPYIGMVEISPDDVAMKGKIKVQYKLDAFSGACVAEVLTYTKFTGWIVTHTYSGNCMAQFPLSNASYLGMYASVAGSTIGGIAMGATGNYAGAAMAIGNMFTSRPNYSRSGSVSNVAGLLTKQTPYIIKAVPMVYGAGQFKHDYGYKSFITQTVGSANGFISGSASQMQLSGISKATQEELDEIQSLLGQGIYTA